MVEKHLITLYRPVRPKELKLIEESGMKRFPKRLAEQPIFYPVMNEEYATQIARDWNVPASGSGFVTKFNLPADYLQKYKVENVGEHNPQRTMGPRGRTGGI